MGQISIRISDEDEIFLKRIADTENKSLAELCREKLLNENVQEQDIQLNRETIEIEIEKLKHSIDLANENIMILSKHILKQSKINSELMHYVLDIATDNDDMKNDAINTAEQSANDFVKKIFGE